MNHMTTLADPTPVQHVTNAGMSGWDVFMSWVLTPTGAVLMLLLMGLGVASAIRRGSRILRFALTTVGVLFLIWVVGGVLEAFGIPVRETIATIGSYIPTLMAGFLQFLKRLFETAG